MKAKIFCLLSVPWVSEIVMTCATKDFVLKGIVLLKEVTK